MTEKVTSKVAIHRFFNHLTQFLESAAFSDDAVSQGRGDIAAIYIVFLNLEDDFAHNCKLRGLLHTRKSRLLGMILHCPRRGHKRDARIRRGLAAKGLENGSHIAFAKASTIHFVEGVDGLAHLGAAYGSFP